MTSIEINKAEITREAWLRAAVETFRPRFEMVGHPLPAKVHVSVGFGHGAKAESRVIRGQCWSRAASADGVNHVFISPCLGEGGDAGLGGVGQVLLTLLHELIHVSDDCVSGHKGAFAEIATRLGFEGKMTTSEASIELAAELMIIASELGEYPHGRLDVAPVHVQVGVDPEGNPIIETTTGHSGPGTQTTRYLKATCFALDENNRICGYSVRITRKWADKGLPTCPCGNAMEWA